MATVQNIVDGALSKLGVVDLEETPPTSFRTAGLAVFNGLMHEQAKAGWFGKDADGVNNTFTTQLIGDTFGLDPEFEEGAKAAVAVRLAPNFPGIEPSRQVRSEATLFFAQLAAEYYTPSTFERGFRYESVDNEYSADV